VKQVIEQPQPAEFFRLFGVDTTMQGVAARLYERACGRDPEPVIAEQEFWLCSATQKIQALRGRQTKLKNTFWLRPFPSLNG
jgi:hypothetical protein